MGFRLACLHLVLYKIFCRTGNFFVPAKIPLEISVKFV